jgi:FdhD protein
MDDVENIIIDTENYSSDIKLKDKQLDPQLLFKRLYTSGCGRGAVFYNVLDLVQKTKIKSRIKFSANRIITLMSTFQKHSLAFKETGGVHSAALSDGKDILIFQEDIGRHNALDKVIGEALLKGVQMQELIVLSSGRISTEIVSKTAKMKVACLISRSAPTDQAIKLARELNLTLVGFARGKRMNVYSGTERIE